ncbi:hypothetical protein QE152_g9518 [Popillia japonica]|uniref:Uncharacterized protein n=1 Tax=Popillia japonica TaxID=7064 RepID=A0AAW1LXG1_POPJA
MEQYSRRNIICIFGLPEKENEIVEETVINLCKEKLDIDIPPANIDRTHRLGSLQTRRNNKRAIILKLTNYTVLQRDLYKEIQQRYGTKSTYTLDGTIYVRVLTKSRRDLYKEIQQRYGTKSTYTLDGTIYVKVGDKKHKVNSLQDLENIK